MKSEKKTTRPKSLRENLEEESAADPFAADLFASGATGAATALVPELPEFDEDEELPEVPWQSRLAAVPRSKAFFSAESPGLPRELVSGLWLPAKGVLARYAQTTAEAIYAGWQDISEVTAAEYDEQTGNAPHIFAALRLEPGNFPFTLALEADFAVCLTDRLLGGPGEPPDSLRNLSTGERAVIEFLALQVLRELDQPTAPFALRLEQISPAAPLWLGEADKDLSLGLLTVTRLQIGPLSGLARGYFPSALMKAVSQPAIAGSQIAVTEKLSALSNIAPEVPLAVLIGQTPLKAEELLSLELGDVVVVEWPQAEWEAGAFRNRLNIRVGDGAQALLCGLAQDGSATINLVISDINAGNAPTLTERLNMDIPLEEESLLAPEPPADEEVGEGAALLDSIMLTLHVELAARRVRLDELARLRLNQVLELGCKATDPVDLLVDGRRVARGELVDVEGRLGVRITHLA
jgi:type III secretion system YscQ/HrcQ family protein